MGNLNEPSIVLNKLFKFLQSNNNLKKIYNIKYNDFSVEKLKCNPYFCNIDWERVYEAFIYTLTYINDFCYKNDDCIRGDFDLSESVYDILKLAENSVLRKSFDEKTKFLLLKTHVMLVMFCLTNNPNKYVDELITPDLNLKNQNIGAVYFRGHTNDEYQLIPSMFRYLRVPKKDKFLHLNWEEIEKLYKKSGLIAKHKNIFYSDVVDYDFLAFMQHATSYSPLLDLTSNHIVALSFATTKNEFVSLETYLNKNASIIKFSLDNNLIIKDKLKEIDVYIFQRKLSPCDMIGEKLIFYSVPTDFNPSIEFMLSKTNDRMKYQSGLFMYYTFCVIVNGTLLLPYKKCKIIKYIIPPKAIPPQVLDKRNIHNRIKSNKSQYDYDHLMNPYKYFSEN